MSGKLHIYCYNEWEVSTIDNAPLTVSDVSWSLVVMVLVCFIFDYCLECIPMAIPMNYFYKNFNRP